MNYENIKNRLWTFVRDFFFPMSIYCAICGSLIDNTRTYSLCDDCIRKVRFGHYYIDLDKESKMNGREKMLDSAMVAMIYGTYEKKLVTKLKYAQKTYIARIIAEILKDRVLSYDEDYFKDKFLVPVPSSIDRLRERGFNQTEKIVNHLKKEVSADIINAMIRKNSTEEQTKLNPLDRFVNTSDVFEIKEDVKGKKLIIVDDVYTTGATSWNMAKVLKENGAKEVHLLALASRSKFLLEK